MIKRTKWIKTKALGECRFRHRMVVRADLICGKHCNTADHWTVECPTLNRWAYGTTKEEALVLLGEFLLTDLVSFRASAPDGNTKDANELLRLLEVLIIEE